ncbi:hypothetical protein H9P43_001120 [Blastocladiella emersonii ATCC 22665]|nr:hypothetical protein H9P43_001120 [Blastocladiella emersonii ATCC 22665]
MNLHRRALVVFFALAAATLAYSPRMRVYDDRASLPGGPTWVRGNRLAAPGPTIARPVVLWHGMGDSGDDPGMRKLAIALEAHGLTVHRVLVGRDANADRMRSYLDDISKQVAEVCAQLRAVPGLREHGIHAIGFSQGGLFARALIQRCPEVKVHRLITFASPHQGIADVPAGWCTAQPLWCGIARAALRRGAYVPSVQHKVVQAGYVRTQWDLDAYRRGNLFLPAVNNENTEDVEYADRVRALEKLVLVKHADDTVLIPAETAWFSELIDATTLVPLHNTTQYKRDSLGLRTLDDRGDLVFAELPGDHMQFSVESFLETVLPFLLPSEAPMLVHQTE